MGISLVLVGCASVSPAKREACGPRAIPVSGTSGWEVRNKIDQTLEERFPGFRQVAFLMPGLPPQAQGMLAERSRGVIQCGPQSLVWWYEITTAKGERKVVYFAVGPWLDPEIYLVPGKPGAS